MAKSESKISAATGIAVLGRGEKSQPVELAMRQVAMDAAASGHDDHDATRRLIAAARDKAKVRA